MTGRGLYDPCLAMIKGEPVVGNDIDADGAALVVITGANQGASPTLLRSVGLAQLMIQAGMFVAARSVHADVRGVVFSHFKREEDAGMRASKLDEELNRMNDIADEVNPGDLVLSNESFASTNEPEGSRIAHQVVSALVDSGVKVVLVTHLFDLADRLFTAAPAPAVFLRADPGPGGRRTFTLGPGRPLTTGHGEDVYDRVFGDASPHDAPATPTAGVATTGGTAARHDR